ncbi:hypothetical protein NQ318_019601 [Aromia moschata]|uniref:Uncharacterized protein n=1 Tax=Aromia moschata TaxID=1265417 RepID=A0AAV8Z550_9CUCU|nr:hypothetical protein NQ318_019601 [Aromia moschata]
MIYTGKRERGAPAKKPLHAPLRLDGHPGELPPPNRMRSSEKLETIDDAAEKHPQKAPVTDIKLEPIKCKPEMNPRKANGILDANPAENIKNRLSSASARSKDSTESSPSNRGKARSSGSEISLENTPGDSEANGLDSDSPRGGNMEDLRSESDEKLEKLAKNLDVAIQRATDNTNEDFEQKLGEHCSNLMGSVRSCSERLDAQKESLKISRDDTAAIAEAFKKTQKIEASLKSSFLSVEDANMDFLSEILSEELKFQATNKPTDRNGNVKEPKVNLEEKKKLLATLKAIDNGDNVESIGNSPPHGQTNLMKEIFGDVSK